MSQTALPQFDSTVQTTHVWLNDILERLGWEEPYRAYHALRAVLHALRDQLPVNQLAALAAQLPMLVRGFYTRAGTRTASRSRNATRRNSSPTSRRHSGTMRTWTRSRLPARCSGCCQST
jgi:uncharacterized protein (DUF2267 family)